MKKASNIAKKAEKKLKKSTVKEPKAPKVHKSLEEEVVVEEEVGDISHYDGTLIGRYASLRAEKNAQPKVMRERLSISHTLFTLFLTLSFICAVIMMIIGAATLNAGYHDLSIGLIAAGLAAMLLLMILTFLRVSLYDALFTAEKHIKALNERIGVLEGQHGIEKKVKAEQIDEADKNLQPTEDAKAN